MNALTGFGFEFLLMANQKSQTSFFGTQNQTSNMLLAIFLFACSDSLSILVFAAVIWARKEIESVSKSNHAAIAANAANKSFRFMNVCVFESVCESTHVCMCVCVCAIACVWVCLCEGP